MEWRCGIYFSESKRVAWMEHRTEEIDGWMDG